MRRPPDPSSLRGKLVARLTPELVALVLVGILLALGILVAITGLP